MLVGGIDVGAYVIRLEITQIEEAEEGPNDDLGSFVLDQRVPGEGEQSVRIPGKGRRMTMTDTAAIRPAIPMSSPAPHISMSPLELDGYLTGIVVTPKAAPILPRRWIAHLWDEEPVFDDDLQIKLVLGPVINHYNVLGIEIDRSLKRLENEHIVDYRPRFLR
jgi:hypothetical protein